MNELQKLDRAIHSNDSNRLDALLSLRGIACFLVIIYHLGFPRNSVVYKGYDLSWILFSDGKVAVWIFFCLSGYLMGKGFFTKRYTADVAGVRKFWRNRILRIFPLYYFSTLILTILVYPEVLQIEQWGYLLRTLTFTYHFLLPGVNGVLWSLSTELQFYICVPFIYNFFKPHLSSKKNIISSFVSVLFVLFLARLIVWISFHESIRENIVYSIKYWYIPLPMNLDLFICGFLVNAWINSNKQYQYNSGIIINAYKRFNFLKFHKLIAVLLVVGLYLFTAHHNYYQELAGLLAPTAGVRTSTTFFILQPLTALVTSYFIFAFEYDTYHEFGKNQKLSFDSLLKNPVRFLEVLGTLSYGLYIWHQVIIKKITPIFTSPIPVEAFYSRFIATMILSILLSSVTYYLVELPATKWKKDR